MSLVNTNKIIIVMDKNKTKKQPATKEAMPVKETKVAAVKQAEIIVEAPSKVEAKPIEVKPKKKHYRKPVKKQVAVVAPVPAKKLNWFQKVLKTITKWF